MPSNQEVKDISPSSHLSIILTNAAKPHPTYYTNSPCPSPKAVRGYHKRLRKLAAERGRAFERQIVINNFRAI